MKTTTKTAETVAKLKTLSGAAMVKATWANSTIEHYEQLAIASLYSRLAKMV